MYKVGEGMLGRLNLGGAGGGLNRQGANEVSMSTNNLNLGANKGDMGTYRSNIGVDKSMDNFKVGFSQNFGAQLGLGQSKLGGNNMETMSAAGTSRGAVIQPKIEGTNQAFGQDMSGNGLDTSIRKSNLLSTPSSKGAREHDGEDFEK
jgi:hypothetical protein